MSYHHLSVHTALSQRPGFIIMNLTTGHRPTVVHDSFEASTIEVKRLLSLSPDNTFAICEIKEIVTDRNETIRKKITRGTRLTHDELEIVKEWSLDYLTDSFEEELAPVINVLYEKHKEKIREQLLSELTRV